MLILLSRIATEKQETFLTIVPKIIFFNTKSFFPGTVERKSSDFSAQGKKAASQNGMQHSINNQIQAAGINAPQKFVII